MHINQKETLLVHVLGGNVLTPQTAGLPVLLQAASASSGLLDSSEKSVNALPLGFSDVHQAWDSLTEASSRA